MISNYLVRKCGNFSYILLDLGTFLGPSNTKYGEVRKVSDREIEGFTVMDKILRRPKEYPIYFVIQFDTQFTEMNAWQNGQLLNKITEFSGENGGTYCRFDTRKGKTIKMKVGISYVSVEQARINIKEELPHWNFDKIVNESFQEWNNYLGRIHVEGGSIMQKKRFYTDLWHALLGRRIISDVNGKYSDMTGEQRRIGQIPLDKKGKPKFNHYNSDSFWGAQWTITTLWNLVYPEISEEFVNSMLMMYHDGGFIPRGPAAGNYTYVMTGASSTPFIVSAYMKGIRGFDIEQAFQGMKKNHMPGGMMSRAGYEYNSAKGGGLEYYKNNGYVPYPLPEKVNGFHLNGAGQTLEYASQDWCLAQMAKALNKEKDYQYFMTRSANWKNLYDKETGWMRPKDINGKWIVPFDPFEYSKAFVESNAAQATWFVPHDLSGLAILMGGEKAMSEKLNNSFEQASEFNYISSRKGAINYGNQPSIQTAFIFNHIGYPHLTQYWSRQIVKNVYSSLTPYEGYGGDEDQGLMGSLAVLMKMGLFEMNAGCETEPMMELGSPIFDKITIQLNRDYYQGKEIVIETKNNSEQNLYIQQAFLNGKPIEVPFIQFNNLIRGGKLTLIMRNTPNKIENF